MAETPRSKKAAVAAMKANTAAIDRRPRSVSTSSASSTGSRTSDRLSDKDTKASQSSGTPAPHFGVTVTKVHATTTGTDTVNNTRRNALTAVAEVNRGDVILDMHLPCSECGRGQLERYEAFYEGVHPQSSVQFRSAAGTKYFAELIGPAPRDAPGQCEISLAYFANDARSATSATAKVQIVLVGDGSTCRFVMTATKPVKPGEEVMWAYSGGVSTLSDQSGPGGKPVRTDDLLPRVIAVMPSGAGVTEVKLTYLRCLGDGACFYTMFASQLPGLGESRMKRSKLRKQLSDYLLNDPPPEAVEAFKNWGDTYRDGPFPLSLQTYKDPGVKLTLEEYAKRILIGTNYVSEYDIQFLLRLYKVNLGMVVYTPNGKGYHVSPEVKFAGDVGWKMIYAAYIRHPTDDDTENHWDALLPAKRAETPAFGDDCTVKLSWFGLYPKQSPEVASTAAVTKSPEVASAAAVAKSPEEASAAAVAKSPEEASAAAVTRSIPAKPAGAVTQTGKGKRKRPPAPTSDLDGDATQTGKGKGKGKRPAAPTSDLDGDATQTGKGKGKGKRPAGDLAYATRLSMTYAAEDKEHAVRIAEQRAVQVAADALAAASIRDEDAKRIRDEDGAGPKTNRPRRTAREKRD